MRMYEVIVWDLGKNVLAQLNSEIIQEVKLALGVEDELERMKNSMSNIQSVLKDAEKEQSTFPSINSWLQLLQGVIYDIDDLLDEISTEFTLQGKNKGQWREQVRKFFSRDNSLLLRSQWVHQIKNLHKQLHQWEPFSRNYLFFTEHGESSDLASRTTHNSHLVVGRDEDKEAVMNLVLQCSDQANLSVVPIVGAGGIGKTTLARLIFDDTRIDENFDKKLWVYVAKKFNTKKILTLVLSMATRKNILQLSMEQLSPEQLRIKISEAFRSKKYFLVLDGVRNKDSNELKQLREFLNVGAKGSTVVVTTTRAKVASDIKTVDEYKLSELSHESSLEIFKRLAFIDGETIDSTFLNLSKKIVEKSRGLPLLVTSLGNLLHGNKEESKWDSVIQKLELEDDNILKILKLSYDQLDSYAKLCFRVSSVYGKGFEAVPLHQLLPLWTALGFLPCDNEGEELGRKCVEELSFKSFLTKEDDDAPHDLFNRFRMHDLMFDLAKTIAGVEVQKISTYGCMYDARYIRLEGDDMSAKQFHQGLLNEAKKARLLLINTSEESLSKDLLESIVSSFKCLRALDLNGCQFEELPKRIGYMKHLRYLNLAGNVKIKHLPDSVCNLVNLQTLILLYCNSLQELPSDIGRLENLRYLMVTIQHEFLPESIGDMKSLGMLFLCNCPNLAFLPSSTKQLENLDTLFMFGCKKLDLAHGAWSLEGLNSLRVLGINDLPKFDKLQIGVEDLPFTSLQHLFFIKCEGFTEVGDWIKGFASLKTLKIVDCYNLKGLPYTRQHFAMLQNLQQIEINGEIVA